jgi:hypothetical protein
VFDEEEEDYEEKGYVKLRDHYTENDEYDDEKNEDDKEDYNERGD